MGFLTGAVQGLIYIAILVGVGFAILAGVGGGLTGTASTAVNTMTTALNTNLVGNFGLIVLIIVMAFILSIVLLLRARGSGGGL